MALAEDLVCTIAADVLRDCGTELDTIDSIRSEAEEHKQLLPRREALAKVQKPFPRLHHAEAIARLRAAGVSAPAAPAMGPALLEHPARAGWLDFRL